MKHLGELPINVAKHPNLDIFIKLYVATLLFQSGYIYAHPAVATTLTLLALLCFNQKYVAPVGFFAVIIHISVALYTLPVEANHTVFTAAFSILAFVFFINRSYSQSTLF